MRRNSLTDRLENWGQILQTQNLAADRVIDSVSRGLLTTRASVSPMTIISALIGGLFTPRTRSYPD